MSRLLAWIGGLFSGVYAVGLAWVVFQRWPELRALELNELGDFSAGAFGPLAIVWLVLGYFQQGIELRINTDALKLQATELANSVEQQRELVKVTKDQHEMSREDLEHRLRAAAEEEARRRRAALPQFIFEPNGAIHSGGHSKFHFSLTNKGPICRNVSFERPTVEGEPTISAVHRLYLEQNAAVRFEVRTEASTPLPYDEALVVHFVDSLAVPGKLHCRLHVWLDDSGARARITTRGLESANAPEDLSVPVLKTSQSIIG